MTATRFLTALAIAGLLGHGPAGAQIYRTTDENGNVVFTDKPPAGDRQVEEVQLRQLNTTPSTPPAPQSPPPEASPEAPDYRVSIAFPTDETTIPMGPGNFSVSASTFPPLRDGETLQLQIDGSDRGESQASGSWELTNVFRGAHELTVQRRSAEGEVLATSEAVTVYVHRPSVNFQGN